MNQLILPCAWNEHKPPVKSVVIRQPGKLTGVRLISYRSLIDYLNSLAPSESEG